jgi:GNAT superfamily N-acetyltransferase
MIHIRPATEADHPRLARIFLDARVQVFHGCDPSLFQLDDFITQTEGEVIHVAVDEDGQLLGFVSVWRQDGFIHHLFVDPSQQRRGVGTALLKSLHEWLPFPHRLKCLMANSSARAFYLKSGWRDVSLGADSLGEYALMEFAQAVG